MKYEVILTEVRSLVMEIEAKDSDTAVRKVRSIAEQKQLFVNRIGTILAANVKRIKDGNDS